MSINFYGGHVDIIDKSTLGRRRRRIFDPAFKAELMAACQQPGISVAAVALQHGLNANPLRRCITEHERYGHHSGGGAPAFPPQNITPIACSPARAVPAPFVPVSVTSAPCADDVIRLDITRGTASMRVQWPLSGAAQCAELLRQWLR